MYDEKEIQINKPKKIKKEKRKTLKKFSIDLSIFKKINWKALLIKILIAFAVMILIIFTISRINKSTKPNTTLVEAPNDNLTYLTSTILNYYNLKKLPKNNGDSISMIFREMLDFNIIREIKPNDNDNYDVENSYIIVTKETDEYFKLRINLKWTTNELSLTQIFTCNEKNCTLKK